MPKYVFQLWVTVEAESLDAATNKAHYAETLLTHSTLDVTDVFIGDDYEIVVNEYGDTEAATE